MANCVRCGKPNLDPNFDIWGPRGCLCSDECLDAEMQDFPPEEDED